MANATVTVTPELQAALDKILQTRASAMFDALLDYCLGNPEPRTDPQVTQLTITSDGFLMAWNTRNPFKEGLVGGASDFERNVRGIAKHVGLSDELAEQVLSHAYLKINDWRHEGRRGTNPYARKG